MYGLKKLKKRILSRVIPSDVEEVKNDFYNYCLDELFYLSEQERFTVVHYIDKGCEAYEKLDEYITVYEVKYLVVASAKMLRFSKKKIPTDRNPVVEIRKKKELEYDKCLNQLLGLKRKIMEC